MKRLSILSLGLVCLFPCFSQVNREHNQIRPGDEIIKQQVEYQKPGEAGSNKVWDFSRLKTINDAYKLTYTVPPLLDDSLYIMGDYQFNKKQVKQGELIVGTEHHTMYYYQQQGDSLFLLGHENPTVRLQYTQPVLQLLFPAEYGQAEIVMGYNAKGLYSSTVPITSRGDITIGVDAFGKMILPTGDTLNPVVRIKHIKTFTDENHISTTILATCAMYCRRWP